jgi:predicted PurR-regulated permease PerM
MLEKEPTMHISISTGTIVRGVLVLLGVVLVWLLRDLILVLLTSIVIASFVESAVPTMERLRLGRVFGVVLLYAVGLSALAFLFYLFAPLLITELYNFSGFISAYIPGVKFLHFFQNEAFSGAKDIVGSLSNNFSLSNLVLISKAFIENLSGGFFTAFSIAFGSLFNFVLIIMLLDVGDMLATACDIVLIFRVVVRNRGTST